MTCVALAGIVSWAAVQVYKDDRLIFPAFFVTPPAIYLGTVAFLFIRYRHL